jgi:hypothetical protein
MAVYLVGELSRAGVPVVTDRNQSRRKSYCGISAYAFFNGSEASGLNVEIPSCSQIVDRIKPKASSRRLKHNAYTIASKIQWNGSRAGSFYIFEGLGSELTLRVSCAIE